MRLKNIRVLPLPSPFWIAEGISGELHLTADHNDGIPVFSRNTKIGETWSFHTSDDIKYYEGMARAYSNVFPRVHAYYILHNDELNITTS